MEITAAMVKELRTRTGAGMMECKKALKEAEGDMEGAIEAMRKAGLAKADKKSGRVAAEGVIVTRVAEDGRTGVMVEINSETDFVAKNEEFQQFAARVAERVLESNPADVAELSGLTVGGGDERDIATATKELVAKIGENLEVRRFERRESENGQVASYLHGNRIGVLVDYTGAEQVGKDVAMHVAANNPAATRADDIPQDELEKERQFLEEQARDSGKPEEIVKKMVEGRLRKHLSEITLLGQPFVKDPDQTVEEMLKANDADVSFFRRFEVGEGKEKKEENFADEVMAQAKGA
ncbi:translation elongation factor Ts [Halofilum ochraceum]|uniref:translation elongation factor Ts n=1 Tax=Halofilum ochraceum TaxID=1611323 RepID=UPI00082AC506|nr:translation elongation factor Ts [Halofilum ochraceum]